MSEASTSRDAVTSERVHYEWFPGGLVQDELLIECSHLYSDHYGVRSLADPDRPGQRVRLSADRLREWLQGSGSGIYLARVDGNLVGYAIAVQTKVQKYGNVAWVTQLVVHTDHRDRGIAKTLLYTIWGFSSFFAWGIVTASPYAVRALEKATRRRSSPARIARNYRKLHSVGEEHVPYIHEETRVLVGGRESRVFTQFYVDHSDIPVMIEAVTSPSTPWLMGELEEGWEWFAFTFQDQDPINLSTEEIESMLAASDDVTKLAYSRMNLSGAGQGWMRHTEYEVERILRYCDLAVGDSVLDLGCGTGRHCLALGRRSITTLGVDYIDANVAEARRVGADLPSVTFEVGDCRTTDVGQFDAVLCLYDVIGSYADDESNLRILENVARHTRPGGRALISVMNFELTESQATRRFTFSSDPNALLSLPASRTMERTGNVFNPDLYLVDPETRLVYRREQFVQGQSLPVELIVRDRRYRAEEFREMCRKVGLEVIWMRHVRAGSWDETLAPDDPSAKEILVLCKRPSVA